MSNLVAIGAIGAKDAADAIPDASLEDRARAAMRAMQHHWCLTNPNEQFVAACEGLAQHCKELGRTEEFDRILDDSQRLAKASALVRALTTGVPVDWDAIETPEPPANPLGLRALWGEVTGA